MNVMSLMSELRSSEWLEMSCCMFGGSSCVRSFSELKFAMRRGMVDAFERSCRARECECFLEVKENSNHILLHYTDCGEI